MTDYNAMLIDLLNEKIFLQERRWCEKAREVNRLKQEIRKLKKELNEISRKDDVNE